MADQFSLFGDPRCAEPKVHLDPPESGRSCALFFAVQPEPEDAERISQRAAAQRKSLDLDEAHLVDAHRLHVSLHSLGSFKAVPDALLARALDVASRLQAAPFEVCFDQLLSYRNGRIKPLVLQSVAPVFALQAVHQQLGMALADAGLTFSRQFNAHMTLSRHPSLVPAQVLEPLHWTARRFVLIWSHMGLTRYELAGEWLLCG